MKISESLIIQGDCLEKLKELPAECVDCCITSPPYYGLRDYGMKEQIGLENTPEEYIDRLVGVLIVGNISRQSGVTDSPSRTRGGQGALIVRFQIILPHFGVDSQQA